GPRAAHRYLTGVRPLEREVLAVHARLRSRQRGRLSDPVRSREAHRSGVVRRRVPTPPRPGAMAIGRLDDLARSYFDLRWHLDPVGASQAGVTSYDGRLGRYGKATLTPHLAALRALAAALEEASTDSLDEEIDRTALLNDVRVTLARFEKEKPQTKNPEFWLSHLLNGLHVVLARRDSDPEQRARSLLERLEEVPAFLDDARAT